MATLIKPDSDHFEALPARSTDIADLRQAASVYFRAPASRIMVMAVVAATVVRVALAAVGAVAGTAPAPIGIHDLVALAVVVALTGTVEWVIHTFLLHAPEDSFRTRVLGVSNGHRRHHEDPTVLENVVLGTVDAFTFLPAIAGFTALWSLPVAWLAGWPLLATFGTGLAASWWTLAHYEWVHLAVHTGHRFRNRYYARLQRNHRWHHYRNENYWLGVTSNTGDRLLRTLPADKTDVPLSPTAKSLA
jgi:hypothetical protein